MRPMSPDSLFFLKKKSFLHHFLKIEKMTPTSTATKTQTQLGFDPSTSHMVREHFTIWAIEKSKRFLSCFAVCMFVCVFVCPRSTGHNVCCMELFFYHDICQYSLRGRDNHFVEILKFGGVITLFPFKVKIHFLNSLKQQYPC